MRGLVIKNTGSWYTVKTDDGQLIESKIKVPGGTQGPLGKGGAAERWRVAYPIGIATRHGAKPATTRTYKSRPPPGRRAHQALQKAPPRRQATANLA